MPHLLLRTIKIDIYLCAYVCCMNDGGGGSVHSCVCPDWLEVVCIGRISYTFQIKIMSATKLWWCVWEINQTSPKKPAHAAELWRTRKSMRREEVVDRE